MGKKAKKSKKDKSVEKSTVQLNPITQEKKANKEKKGDKMKTAETPADNVTVEEVAPQKSA